MHFLLFGIPVSGILFYFLIIKPLWVFINFIQRESEYSHDSARKKRIAASSYRPPGIVELISGLISKVFGFIVGLVSIAAILFFIALILGLIAFQEAL